MLMGNCCEVQEEEKADKRGGEEVGEEEEEEEEEGGWVWVDKTTDLPGFPDLGCSGEEGWLEQDGKVCDKRNSSDFIVPPRHTTNVSFETRSNVETQDGGLQNELMQQRESGCGGGKDVAIVRIHRSRRSTKVLPNTLQQHTEWRQFSQKFTSVWGL